MPEEQHPGPDTPRVWTVPEIIEFTEHGIAEARALAAQSPAAARAKLAEHLSDVINLATAAARAVVRLQEELREQGAPEGEIAEYQLRIDRIMTSAGKMLTTAMEIEVGDAP